MTDTSSSRPLIVRIRNFIGDVVLGVPALERLQQAGYELHLIGKPWAKSLLEAYGWPVNRYPKAFGERRNSLKQMAKPLRAKDVTFDRRLNAVTFATSFSSALDMRCAGLKPFGYAVEGRSFLLKSSLPIVYGEHALDSYCRLTNALLNEASPNPQAVQLKVSEHANEAAHAALAIAGVRPGYIVLVPFAGGTFEKLDKKWPHFAGLAQRLASSGRDLVMAPGPDEMDIARAIAPHAKLLPKLDLGPYCAVLRDAALTIANDTGPGHMAASVGGRLLSVLGPTKIEQWGPRGPLVTIVQSYPEWPSVDAVADAASSLLEP
ncbi:MAG: glycosyltransferase family 9 protein [Casimicrobium sp.]